MSNHVTRQEESSRLDDYQGTIDMDLREVGFDEVLGRHSIDASLGMIVVGRDFVHSTQLADVDHDLDPLASRLAVCHEVGLYQRVGNGALGKCWRFLGLSWAISTSPAA